MPSVEVELTYKVNVEWEEDEFEDGPQDFDIIDIAEMNGVDLYGSLTNWDIKWKSGEKNAKG